MDRSLALSAHRGGALCPRTGRAGLPMDMVRAIEGCIKRKCPYGMSQQQFMPRLLDDWCVCEMSMDKLHSNDIQWTAL